MKPASTQWWVTTFLLCLAGLAAAQDSHYRPQHQQIPGRLPHDERRVGGRFESLHAGRP